MRKRITNNMKLIAFTGNIGAGKTTASDILVKEFGYTKINFKDMLLEEVKEKFSDLLREINSHYRFKNNEELLMAYPRPPLVRALLQNFGTDVRRADNLNYWTERWGINVSGKDKVVVDDLRFVNESLCVKDLGGKIYRINGIIKVDQFKDHASEIEMTKIVVDEDIYNHRTIEEFQEKIRKIALQNQ